MTTEVAKVYEQILHMPVMSDTVKIDLRLSRKAVLLLKHVVDQGLKAGEKDNVMPGGNSDETMKELRTFIQGCQIKAGLEKENPRQNAK